MMMSLLKRREGGKDMSLGETRGRRSDMVGGEGMLRSWHGEERQQIRIPTEIASFTRFRQRN